MDDYKQLNIISKYIEAIFRISINSVELQEDGRVIFILKIKNNIDIFSRVFTWSGTVLY